MFDILTKTHLTQEVREDHNEAVVCDLLDQLDDAHSTALILLRAEPTSRSAHEVRLQLANLIAGWRREGDRIASSRSAEPAS